VNIHFSICFRLDVDFLHLSKALDTPKNFGSLELLKPSSAIPSFGLAMQQSSPSPVATPCFQDLSASVISVLEPFGSFKSTQRRQDERRSTEQTGAPEEIGGRIG
jgi:hypothetical protein